MASSRTFTIDQANKMLPLVKSITKDIQTHWERIILLRTEIECAFEKKDITAPASLKEELDYLVDKINNYIGEVESLGLFVAEFKRGVINFPSLRNGQKIFLSWMAGEEVVEYWYDLDEGFGDRKHTTLQESMK
jgi:hypothetical protein